MIKILKKFSAAIAIMALVGVIGLNVHPVHASGEKFMIYTIANFDHNNMIVVFDVLDGTTSSTDKSAYMSSAGTWTEDSLRDTAVSTVVSWANANGYPSATATDVIVTNKSTSLKKQETFSGTSNASGLYTVTFANAYTVAPNIQANIINATDTQTLRITSVSTTGFTVLARNRTDTLGLLPTYSNVSGAAIDVVVTQK